ncbi:MAG: AraC family transcriptional regulator [Burkholderiales bacterium]
MATMRNMATLAAHDVALGSRCARGAAPELSPRSSMREDFVVGEESTMSAPRPGTRLKVVISHCLPLICAGLQSVLSQMPDCDVCVWDDALRRQYGSLHAAGAHIVLSDPDQGVCLLEDHADSNNTSLAGAMRVIIVAAGERESASRAAMERGIAGRISVSYDRQDIIDTVRNVGANLLADPLSRLSANGSPHGGLAPHALRKVCAHMRETIARKIDLEELAGIAKLSSSHFSRAFKQSMGITPHQYLSWRRVQLAARMLRETDQPLAQICLAVGCCDQSHFTRLFAKMMGETPGAYRRRNG